MHNNFFFLRQLVDELKPKLTGLRLLECFSQNKDELILGFADNQNQLYIKADLSPQFCCLSLQPEFHRAKKNSVDLFTKVADLKVLSLQTTQHDRSFTIHFEKHFDMLIKMHGNRANIIILHPGSSPVLFKKNMKKDEMTDVALMGKTLDLSREAFEKVDGDLGKYLPTAGKLVQAYLDQQDYATQEMNKKWSLAQQAIDVLFTPDNYHITEINDIIHLSLLPLGNIVETHHNAIDALTNFYNRAARTNHLATAKNQLLKDLEQKLKKTAGYISKTQGKLNLLKSKRNYSQIADIIMANLHQIPNGTIETTLFDFYENKDITISLSKNHSPQKLAESLYRKSKNQAIEIETTASNLAAKTEYMTSLQEEIDYFKQCEDHHAIRQKLKEGAQTSHTEAENTPYHSYQLMGYEILVGRNAKRNDELTFKIAGKNDLWLHAKDTQGSHVVVRKKNNDEFPGPVIERAAELAAWHSKRKNDTLCPVSYTLRKFVRKGKGLKPGAVFVDKEKVMLVPPRK